MSLSSKVLRAAKYAAITGAVAGVGYAAYRYFGSDATDEVVTAVSDTIADVSEEVVKVTVENVTK